MRIKGEKISKKNIKPDDFGFWIWNVENLLSMNKATFGKSLSCQNDMI